ncbi:hypothetical protein D7Y56_00130 (plasmid) [Streptomyces sp. S501]|uniref:hypothetical protein n=1 Tax=Streptomyces sp. S501 TaxID=2420135 RepID=UPI00106F02C7|nr:hypothetical protein [Streptomyces sp. S501]QBR04510.1 hypothetical protein D7Y56_00130 [Streptomyces sp. S501]
MTDETQGQLSRSWEDFRDLPFPSGFYSREPDGECMVAMDATLAGCISSAINGQLDDKRHAILHSRITRLGELLPLIRDDENASNYFTLLHQTAMLAAEVDDARRA